MSNYILILISVLLATFGQILLKKGVIFNADILTILRNYLIWTGLSCYFLSALLWIKALSRMELSRVYPFTFLTYVLVMSGSYFLFGEKINPINLLIGSILIISGIIILNLNQ